MSPPSNKPHSDPSRSRPGAAALRALESARSHLANAARPADPRTRYVDAHLAALRAAAAVVAHHEKGEPRPRRRRRPRSVWELLPAVAPELSEWAAHFAAGARKRAAAEAFLPGSVTAEEADALRADARVFLALVETMLGVEHRPTWSGRDVA